MRCLNLTNCSNDSMAKGQKNRLDLLGQRFGRLRVVSFSHVGSRNRAAYWNCLCDCGKVSAHSSACLRYGHAQSCGCLGIERRKVGCTKHGAASRQFVQRHLYTTWSGVFQRCCNPESHAYEFYGGRGIDLYWDWRPENGGVRAFIEYVNFALGPRPSGHSLDRVDNNRGYEPGNIRWATKKEQTQNRRINYLKYFSSAQLKNELQSRGEAHATK